MTDELRDGEAITFDEFDCPNVEDILLNRFCWNEWYHGSRVDLKYILGENVEHQTVDLNAPNHNLHAFSNRFDVSKKRISLEERKKVVESGFIFDGVLWVSPRQTTQGDYGVGGRILCWVPEEISNLSQLIKGNFDSPEELEARMLAIKRGYIQQRISKRESHDREINFARRSNRYRAI